MTWNALSRGSIMLRVLKQSFGIYLLIASLIVALEVWLAYQQTRDRIAAHFHDTSTLIEGGLANAVWYVDAPLQIALIEGALSTSEIEAIKLLSAEGDPVLIRGKNTLLDQPSDSSSTLRYQFPIFKPDSWGNGEAIQIGAVELLAGPEIIWIQLQPTITGMILAALGKATALWLIFLYFGWKSISRPLQNIQAFLEHAGKKSKKSNAAYEDEIHILNKTVRTHHNELQNKIAALHEIERRRNQLYGMVAHELRTPVAAINMMATEDHAPIWQKSRLDILNCSQELLNTIDDMRMLINPDLERPVRNEPFTVTRLNTTLAAKVGHIVAATGVQFQQHSLIPAALEEIEYHSDTYRIQAALTNLVKNACLHSKGTVVEMSSNVHLAKSGSDFLEWRVSDNGTGIPDDQISRLFNRGERGDTESDGSGLGLYITKSWIEEIGGSIAYRTRKSGGSEFLIQVPLIRDEQLQDRVQQLMTEQPTESREVDELLKGLNVLLVEDERLLRMLGEKLLSKHVNTVTSAKTGADGLEIFDPAKHNLILTDYFMPEMTGVEMTCRLREQGYKGVILGITAATIGEQGNEMLEAGVDLVLPKPLCAEKFRSAVAQLYNDGYFSKQGEPTASSPANVAKH